MIKNLLLFFICCFSIFNAQILDEYPKNQDFYEGGVEQFYKEAHDFLLKNNISECSHTEIYQPRIIVTKESEIKMIKDGDEESIQNNKCTYDISLLLLKNLKGWKPAEVKGQKFGAITEFIVYSKDLQSNYKTGYNPNRFIISAQYPKGNDEFNKDFHDNFMSLFHDYHINGNVNLEFYINKSGKIVNARFFPAVMDQDFNKDFMRALNRMKKVWKPALYSNIPIKQRISFPVNFSIRFIER